MDSRTRSARERDRPHLKIRGRRTDVHRGRPGQIPPDAVQADRSQHNAPRQDPDDHPHNKPRPHFPSVPPMSPEADSTEAPMASKASAARVAAGLPLKRVSPRRDRGGVTSGARRDADSPLRKVEKCNAGVPTRRGSDSPPWKRRTHLLTLIRAQRPANPSRDGIARNSPELHFSGRRPRRRAPDVIPPRSRRGSLLAAPTRSRTIPLKLTSAGSLRITGQGAVFT